MEAWYTDAASFSEAQASVQWSRNGARSANPRREGVHPASGGIRPTPVHAAPIRGYVGARFIF